MAGFFGTARLSSDSEAVGRRMITRIAHRGPDGNRVVADERAAAVFGYARLAINDLSAAGTQPMQSRDGAIVLTVNGEIYDWKRHRAMLAADGETFTSRSDSEVLIGLYRRFGPQFCERIRGEFAAVIYDRDADRVVLTRDRFGVRPLYYYLDEHTLVWASEVKALFAHPAVPRRLSIPAALNQLAQVMVPGSSAFERIQAVRPGHQLVVERRAGRLVATERRYWDLDFDESITAAEGDAEVHARRVRDAIIDAVLVRAESDAPLGVYLSGGLDSAIVLGVAASALQRAPVSVTLGFAHEAYDEARVAAAVADAYRSPLSVRHVDHRDLYGESFARALWHSERTFYNTLGVAKMHLGAHARQIGLRAVLTGEGADELFAGYPAFALDAPSGGLAPGGGADPLHGVLAGSVVARERVAHPELDRLWGGTPGWIQPWVALWNRVQPLLRRGLTSELRDYDPIAAVAAGVDASRIPKRCRLSAAQYTWIKVMLEGQILNWGGDRVDMAHAIESRPVFLDHILAETAARVPASLRIHDGTEKWILRKAMRELLPAAMRDKRKFPLLAPPAYRTAQATAERDRLVSRWLGKQQVEAVGVCDPGRVGELLAQARCTSDPAQANEDDKLINHLLGIHMLTDLLIHNDQEVAP